MSESILFDVRSGASVWLRALRRHASLLRVASLLVLWDTVSLMFAKLSRRRRSWSRSPRGRGTHEHIAVAGGAGADVRARAVQDHYNIRLLDPQQFEAAESLQEECKDFLESACRHAFALRGNCRCQRPLATDRVLRTCCGQKSHSSTSWWGPLRPFSRLMRRKSRLKSSRRSGCVIS
jgi:hypothetical protein